VDAASGADLVHRGVHPGVEAHQLRVPLVQRADDDGAAVGRVAVAGHPSAAFQPVQDAGQGRGVQPGAPRKRAGAERTLTDDEVEAVEVDLPEVNLAADQMVEER
jgi:hypothetical protein